MITPGFCDEYSEIYLATGLTRVPATPHGVEERYLTVEEVPLDHAEGMIDDGSIVDATTIIGLELTRRRLAGGPVA